MNTLIDFVYFKTLRLVPHCQLPTPLIMTSKCRTYPHLLILSFCHRKSGSESKGSWNRSLSNMSKSAPLISRMEPWGGDTGAGTSERDGRAIAAVLWGGMMRFGRRSLRARLPFFVELELENALWGRGSDPFRANVVGGPACLHERMK